MHAKSWKKWLCVLAIWDFKQKTLSLSGQINIKSRKYLKVLDVCHKERKHLKVCASARACVSNMCLNLATGIISWFAEFSHFLEGKVPCTVASADCSSETEEHMESLNPRCCYLPTLWNSTWRSHICKHSQQVSCAISACDKICKNQSDKHTELPLIVVVH